MRSGNQRQVYLLKRRVGSWLLARPFYNWKQRYGGLGPSELQRLKQLEEENSKLKKIVAELSPDKQMLQGVLKKNGVYLSKIGDTESINS